MDYYSSQISKLIEELSRLPGIGAKTAQRLAFHHKFAGGSGGWTVQFNNGSQEKCPVLKHCLTLTDDELCPICSSTQRE